MYFTVKKYEHYNRAMGKYISSRQQYNEEMSRGGYVSQEKAEQMVDSYEAKRARKEYTPSKDFVAILDAVKTRKKSKCKSFDDRTIEGIKELNIFTDKEKINKIVEDKNALKPK